MSSAYCTIDELKGEFSSRKDWGVGYAPADDKLQAIIADESDRIDSYCRNRYVTPFSPVPDRVRSLALALAVARVRDILYEGADSADDLAGRKHDDAMRELLDIQAGRATLDAEELSSDDASPGAPAADLPDDSFFTRSKLF